MFVAAFFGHEGKRLDTTAKVNFKICDVTNWNTNNCNNHIARYLKNLRQRDSEIWAVNSI